MGTGAGRLTASVVTNSTGQQNLRQISELSELAGDLGDLMEEEVEEENQENPMSTDAGSMDEAYTKAFHMTDKSAPSSGVKLSNRFDAFEWGDECGDAEEMDEAQVQLSEEHDVPFLQTNENIKSHPKQVKGSTTAKKKNRSSKNGASKSKALSTVLPQHDLTTRPAQKEIPFEACANVVSPTVSERERRWEVLEEAHNSTKELGNAEVKDDCVKAEDSANQSSCSSLSDEKADILAMMTAQLHEAAILRHIRAEKQRKMVLAVPVKNADVICGDMLDSMLGMVILCNCCTDTCDWGFGSILAPARLNGTRGCFLLDGMRPILAEVLSTRLGDSLHMAPCVWGQVEKLQPATTQTRLRQKTMRNKMQLARTALEKHLAAN